MYPGAKIGVLGSNGAGQVDAAADHRRRGRRLQRRGAGSRPASRVGFLPQEPQLDPTKDVLGNVIDGVAHTKGLLDRFEEVCNAMGEPDADFDKLLAEQSELQDKIDAVNGWDLDRQLEIAMDALRLPPADADVDDAVAVASAAASRCAGCCSRKPDLLLLDEPTNHLDAESVAWLERHLQEYHGTVVAVTHDRYFLDNVAGWILELDRGHGIPWEGNYSSWLEQKEQRLAQEEKVDETRRRTLARELEWIRMAPRARQAKGKARINAYDAARRRSRSRPSAREEKLQISIPPGPRLGDLVVEAEQLTQGLRRPAAHRRPLVLAAAAAASSASSARTARARRRCSACSSARSSPTAARSKVGPTVQLAYVDQSRESLDADKTVYEEITGGVDHLKVGDREVHGRAYVAGFNFKGSDQQKRVGDLSGGERNRLHLAKALLMGGNVLLLDEPTNDLDVDTLRALEEALLEFPGCAVVICHDRWFLDRIATHVLAFEGDSEVRVVRGQLLRLRGRPAQAPRRRRRPAAPHQVQAAHAT